MLKILLMIANLIVFEVVYTYVARQSAWLRGSNEITNGFLCHTVMDGVCVRGPE